jgi:hypothetical protein
MSDIRIELKDADKFGYVKWEEMQEIANEAYAYSLRESRTQTEVDNLVETNEPRRYCRSHRDPNNEVGQRFNSNQSYSRPIVARAFVDDALVGWGYTADNISGNKLVRAIKKHSVAKNYLWLREIVVKPEFMRQGIAKEIGKTLLQAANEDQPVSHYSWPDEDPQFVTEKLLHLGFIMKGSKDKEIFGPDAKPARQVGMYAPSVKSVLELL